MSEAQRNILLLLERDSANLFKRLSERKTEYLHEFALKRTREHFPSIFFSRYKEVGIIDLKNLSEDLILALDDFYSKVDELKWYLDRTQDMPQGVQDRVDRSLKDINSSFQALNLFLRASLSE